MLDYLKGQYIEIGFETHSHYLEVDVESVSVDTIKEAFKKDEEIQYITDISKELGEMRSKGDKISAHL